MSAEILSLLNHEKQLEVVVDGAANGRVMTTIAVGSFSEKESVVRGWVELIIAVHYLGGAGDVVLGLSVGKMEGFKFVNVNAGGGRSLLYEIQEEEISLPRSLVGLLKNPATKVAVRSRADLLPFMAKFHVKDVAYCLPVRSLKEGSGSVGYELEEIGWEELAAVAYPMDDTKEEFRRVRSYDVGKKIVCSTTLQSYLMHRMASTP